VHAAHARISYGVKVDNLFDRKHQAAGGATAAPPARARLAAADTPISGQPLLQCPRWSAPTPAARLAQQQQQQQGRHTPARGIPGVCGSDAGLCSTALLSSREAAHDARRLPWCNSACGLPTLLSLHWWRCTPCMQAVALQGLVIWAMCCWPGSGGAAAAEDASCHEQSLVWDAQADAEDIVAQCQDVASPGD
jgi:hypothetical protein